MAMQTDQKSAATKPSEQKAQAKSIVRNVPGTGFMQRRGEYPFGLMPYDFFRMNPFSLLRRMTEEMDRAFQESAWDREVSGQGGWTPAIEVSQRDGKYNVTAELPGLDPKDVKVEVDNDALVIQGERRSEVEEKNAGIERTERQYGLFYRSIPLPEGANVEQAQAKFNNGVLQVTIPLTEQQTNRRAIPVQSESSTQKSSQSHAA
jgi:HSP20 family protein